MRIFEKMSKGWNLGMTSLKIIRDNQKLLLFPVLSSIALIFVTLTFLGGLFASSGLDVDRFIGRFAGDNQVITYLVLFAFYLVSYFVIVFFNMALIHCARLVFDGKEVSLSDGLNFSGSRLSVIFSWALVSATVGVILKFLEDRLGTIGDIVVNLVGAVWSIATFFAVPVIAYENVGPIEAVKRSGLIMKEKFGESIGANFSFGAFFLLGYLLIGLTSVGLIFVHPALAIVVGVTAALLLHTVVAAAKSVFIAATYNHLNEHAAGRFDDSNVLDSIFVQK